MHIVMISVRNFSLLKLCNSICLCFVVVLDLMSGACSHLTACTCHMFLMLFRLSAHRLESLLHGLPKGAFRRSSVRLQRISPHAR